MGTFQRCVLDFVSSVPPSQHRHWLASSSCDRTNPHSASLSSHGSNASAPAAAPLVAPASSRLVIHRSGQVGCLQPTTLPCWCAQTSATVVDGQDTESVSNYKNVTFLTSRAALISPDTRPCCATRPQRSCTPCTCNCFTSRFGTPVKASCSVGRMQ